MICNISISNPAILKIYLNNVLIDTAIAPNTPCVWYKKCILWISGSKDTTLTVRIIDIVNQRIGNDLGLDSIVLIQKPKPPLPIQLISFGAKCIDNKVTLAWTTASEINNAYFSLERTKDGQSFEKVLDYPGAGTSNNLKFYQVFDENPLFENSYYRLKQTDYDGKFTYSDIISVSCDHNNNFNLISVLQAQSDDIEINFVAEEGESYSYNLYNLSGQVLKQFSGNAISGLNSIHINNEDLTAGLYLVVLQNNEKSFSRKIILN